MAPKAPICKRKSKEKLGQVDTGIEYGEGTDLQFTLSDAIPVRQLFAPVAARGFQGPLLSSLQNALANAPQRSVSKDNRPGDPINLIFAG